MKNVLRAWFFVPGSRSRCAPADNKTRQLTIPRRAYRAPWRLFWALPYYSFEFTLIQMAIAPPTLGKKITQNIKHMDPIWHIVLPIFGINVTHTDGTLYAS